MKLVNAELLDIYYFAERILMKAYRY